MERPSPVRFGSWSLPGGANDGRVQVLVSVHRTVGRGLTQEVEGIFRHNPRRWFTLADVMACIRRNTTRAEVNSIIHKMVHGKRLLEVERRQMANARGAVRWIATYRWRI